MKKGRKKERKEKRKKERKKEGLECQNANNIYEKTLQTT